MSLKKSVMILTCLAALSVAVPRENLFAQTSGTQQEELLRQRQQEDLLRQRQEPRPREPQLRPSVSWSLKIVHAHTFEEIYRGTFAARNVNDLEGAKMDIRSQLGFPVNSDQRTVGGEPQLIIWFELGEHARVEPTPVPVPVPAPAPVPISSPLQAPPTLLPAAPPVAPQPAPAAEREDPLQNWVSGGIGFGSDGNRFGISFNYERDVSHVFSLGVSGFYNFPINFGITVNATLFFGRSPFFIGLGLGLGGREYSLFCDACWQSHRHYSFGVLVLPAIGLRIGGRTGGAFWSPNVSFPITLGGSGSNFSVLPGVAVGRAW